MVSLRALAPALLALAGCVVAQDVEPPTSSQAESTQTLSSPSLSSPSLSSPSLSSPSLSSPSLSSPSLSSPSLSSPSLSSPSLSSPSLSTPTTSFQTLPAQTSSSQTASSSSFSSLTTSDPTTLSQVVLTTSSSTRAVATSTRSSEKEKPTLFSEYGCQGQSQTVEPDRRCYAFGTDLEEYFAGISVPSGIVCDWYMKSDCTDKFWDYMQFPGDCQFGYFARTRAKSIKCYRDRRAF